MPGLAGRRARHSIPLRAALQEIGLSLGGRPGERLGERLGMTASRATLLRLVRATPLTTPEPPRVLGVDDWAWRRNHRYGSIICILERRRVVVRRRLIPLTQVRLYVVGAVREAGGRFLRGLSRLMISDRALAIDVRPRDRALRSLTTLHLGKPESTG